MQVAAPISRLRRSLLATRELQRLLWTIGAVLLTLAPHFAHLPAWIPVLIAATIAWRIFIEVRAQRLPPKWLRITIALAALVAVAADFHTLNGLDAGTALLATMAGVKLLESRGLRDYTVLLFAGFVLLFAALLYDQSLLRLPYIVVAAWLLAAALLRLHHASDGISANAALRTTGVMVVQALPLAVLLFLFFPRLPGQFWALPTRDDSVTGLSDEMTPGDISELTISGAVAFRVHFYGPRPPQTQRYWRGPVLHDFDGRSWRRARGRAVPLERVYADGPAYRYRITLEPTQRRWLFALDVPTSWPSNAFRLYDLQLITRDPLATLSSFELESSTNYRTALHLSHTLRRIDTALTGPSNPRTRAFAKQLRASVADDDAYVNAVLDYFRKQDFYYTLTPPKLGDDSVDEFLFETRRGFCEHFASAFTVLMRAVGIPAHVVTGYQGGEYNDLGDYLLLRQSDAHAWSEVWLANRGWVRVDPTAAVAPERIEHNLDAALPDSESVPGRFLRRISWIERARQTWDAINNFWDQSIVQYNEAKQRSLLEWLGFKDADWRELGLLFGGSLAVFFAALTLYLTWRYRAPGGDAVAATYRRLCRKLARAGVEKALHEGPNDYLRRAAVALPTAAHKLDELRRLYNEVRYGPIPRADSAKRFTSLVKQLALQRAARHDPPTAPPSTKAIRSTP